MSTSSTIPEWSYTHRPKTAHTRTAILFHEAGATGTLLAKTFLKAKPSDGQNLPSKFPGWRWVFPRAPGTLYNAWDGSRFWFNITSIEDIREERENQLPGLKSSVRILLSLIESEIRLLDGRAHRVFICGVGQGMATALWTLLCSPIRLANLGLGGLVGFSGYLPFCTDINAVLLMNYARSGTDCRPHPTVEGVRISA